MAPGPGRFPSSGSSDIKNEARTAESSHDGHARTDEGRQKGEKPCVSPIKR